MKNNAWRASQIIVAIIKIPVSAEFDLLSV